MENVREFNSIVTTSPLLGPLLNNWKKVALSDAWLAAGSIAQSVWNHRFRLPPVHGIVDVDIIYFDATDLSEDAEARHAARIRAAFPGLPVRIDVKNEARVHLWYQAKFGYPIAPYTSAVQAIDTFPTTATTVGIRPGEHQLSLHATFGLSDLVNGIVRPNKRQITRDIYEAKISRWQKDWPELNFLPWQD